MFKKISSIHLLGIFIVLLLVYLALEFLGGESRSKSFRGTLVEIDTSAVTRVLIDSKGQMLELKKEGADWKVGLDQGKYAAAQESSVERTLGSLLGIKPSRIATKDPAKWKDYQVDSAGTRVQVFEGDDQSLDLVIGRFGVQGQRSFYTYVRLHEEDQVYAADNFMGISFGTEASDYRNKQILSLTTDSIAEIRFNYPDSAFTLLHSDSLWYVGSELADSAGTAAYLGDIRYVSNSGFVDDVPPSALASPTLSIVFVERNKPEITVKAFRHPAHQWIIQSSANPDSYFASEEIFNEIFVSRRDLMYPPKE